MDVPKEYSELLAIFDHVSIYSDAVVQAYNKVTKSHIDIAQSFEEARLKWKKSIEESEILSKQLKDANKTISDLQKSLQASRGFLDVEKQRTKTALKERDHYARKLNLFRDLLKNDKDIHETTRVRLISNLPNKENEQLDTIMETTDNLMSDLSYTRDDMDSSDISGESEERPEKRRFYDDIESNVTKRRKKSTKTVRKFDLGNGDEIEKLIATTTVTVEQNGPVSATSVFETVPSTSNCYTPKMMKSESDESLDVKMFRNPSSNLMPGTPFGINSINTRPHKFHTKSMIKGETCNVCNRRIKFSTSGAKCKDCKSVCHTACKDKVPLPCVPATTTPNHNNAGTIADYAPKRGPMVPALVVHCIKEIEARGLIEVGLYRIPGSEKDVKALKEKFFKGKGVPNLSLVPDVHTICGCLKDFLRSLKEPLITQKRWDDFVRASEISDEEDKRARLFQIVSQLPQPNRDTLAYIILHLQKVAESSDCKMPLSNLSKMFGPTIIGYSRDEPRDIIGETNHGHSVMCELISIPAEYWESLVKEEVQNENYNIQKTPSSNSLLNFFQTPSGKNIRSARKARYFETP